MMELQDVAKSYPQGRRMVHALRGVSLKISAGEFVSIMGPSGSGKSTLLHLLGALDVPTSGQVLFDGRDLQTLSDTERSLLRRNRIGFIFQFFNLLPTLTAAENVALPLLLGGGSRRQAREKALAGLSQVGLSDRAGHFPEEISGGEMQRVAIARALVIEPLVLLADEPTGNLDSKTGTEILAWMTETASRLGQTVVMVTHDPRAAAHAHRIVTLTDGRIVSDVLADGAGRFASPNA